MRYLIHDVKPVQPGLSVIVPVFQEELAVAQTVEEISRTLDTVPLESEMIFVNDGSTDRSGRILSDLAGRFPHLVVVENPRNYGYGASLKRGIRHASFDRILITDADGTYSHGRIPDLVKRLDSADMVVAARVGQTAAIPWIRRPAKWLLLRYARWLSGAAILDLNSGMRAVWREAITSVWGMLPDGFSFTSTLTLAMHSARLTVEYVPIEYRRRVGRSSIRPLRDTIGIFGLVIRTIMYFEPLRIFGALAAFLFVAAIAIGIAGKMLTGLLPDVTVVSMVTTALVFLGLGLIGDLLNTQRRPPEDLMTRSRICSATDNRDGRDEKEAGG